MHIILTHEQADFDAIASLTAAALLHRDSIAILPNRINRNVRSFLDLCGNELPLHHFKEISPIKIDQITLVDTQALVTLKGISKKTTVSVIDHHQKKKDLPATWTTVFENTGSCTTILVEELKSRNDPLTIILSTLFLLGIYEDTGSLSYANTTSRDLQAAAYLIDKGASLALANQYLNPPLSDRQRSVYDRLMMKTQHFDIHGNRIVVAMADASDLDEEISSIAHKIRDSLDPDALFLVVKTPEGIRLVARSTTDQINVGKIAQQFGGGGHPRAAAALIQVEDDQPTIEIIYKQVLDKLHEFVEPAISAAQIMSKRPLLITPQTSAEEAFNLMQRYGFEGYPVVSEGKIVGLLNRRSVERAIAHKMNLTASSLMDTGEIYVDLKDSLDKVQEVMTETGWGQIPVLDQNSSIVGIITRTDLLKAIGKPKTTSVDKKNISNKLNSALPKAHIALLNLIAKHAHQQKTAIYIVGGFVRDLILNRPSLDFDIVVEGDAIQFTQSLLKQFGGKVNTHKRFGTAKWQIGDIHQNLLENFQEYNDKDLSELPETLDLISARTEFYDFPTALPQVERSSIKLDLHRRDFTINTLALRLDGNHYGELYDYWGGYEDLQAGLIKVLHSLSFVDDPTRLIRAVRFEQRFNFRIEDRTFQLMEEARDLINQVSGDRLRHELNLILSESDPKPALLRLQALNFLQQIHPYLSINAEIIEKMVKILKTPIDPIWQFSSYNGTSRINIIMAYITWFMNLKHSPRLIGKRLRTPAIVTESSIQAQQSLKVIHQYVNKKPSEITEYFDTLSPYVLFILYHSIDDPRITGLIDQYISHWKKVKPFTSGEDLQKLGITPGPIYKKILSRLRKAWLDEEIRSVEHENILLDEVITSIKENGK
jgi:tRNA nucleotidyltransferase (CCA-adding enzyme)